MNCIKCNSKIKQDEKYCSNCGTKINENAVSSRIALKENAKSKKKKPLIITTLIFMIIFIVYQIIFTLFEQLNTTYSISIIGSIILLILGGLLASIYIFDMYGGAIKISRNKKLTTKQILTKFTKRPKNSISLILVILLTSFILFTISIIILIEEYLDIFMPAFITIVVVIIIYTLPIFEMLLFTLADEKNKNKKIITCLKESIALARGNRLEYYGLELSFIWWHILSTLTFGILYIWIYPYIILSEANLYRKWKGEEVFLSDKKELSDPIVILLTVFATIIIISILYILFPKYELISTNKIANLELDDKKISFEVPSHCTLNNDKISKDYVEYNCNEEKGDFISYSLNYHFADDFKEAKKSAQKEYEKQTYNVKIHDYKTKINGKETKVFYIDYKIEKGAEETFRDTYIFYRLSKDIDAEIIISINDVNKSNLTDYVKIKN